MILYFIILLLLNNKIFKYLTPKNDFIMIKTCHFYKIIFKYNSGDKNS